MNASYAKRARATKCNIKLKRKSANNTIESKDEIQLPRVEIGYIFLPRTLGILLHFIFFLIISTCANNSKDLLVILHQQEETEYLLLYY